MYTIMYYGFGRKVGYILGPVQNSHIHIGLLAFSTAHVNSAQEQIKMMLNGHRTCVPCHQTAGGRVWGCPGRIPVHLNPAVREVADEVLGKLLL